MESSGVTLLATPRVRVRPAFPGAERIHRAARDTARFVAFTTDPTRSDRLWPSDPQLYLTNPLGLAYGACGNALFLKDVLGSLPDGAEEWMLARPVDRGEYPPGLWVGAAGIAYAFAELGHPDRAAEWMELVRHSELSHGDPSVYQGAAGWGLGALAIHRRTGDPRYLDTAILAGRHLARTAERSDAGVFWKDGQDRIRLGFAYGASGVALFLLYLFRETGDEEYLELARGGVDFDVSHGRRRGGELRWGSTPDDVGTAPYWMEGTSGVGTTLIRFYRELREERYLDLAREAERGTETFLSASPHSFRGMTSIGEFVLDMFLCTGEAKYLERAKQCAERTLLYRVEMPQGLAFPGRYLVRFSTDFAYGSSGIGAFLHRLSVLGPRRLHDLGV